MAGIGDKSLTKPARTVLAFEVEGATARVDLPDEGRATGATQFSPIGNGIDGNLSTAPRSHPAGLLYATGYLGLRPEPVPSQFDSPTGRHTNGSNFLFADDHIKWSKPEDISSGLNAAHPTDSQSGTSFGNAAGTASKTFTGTFSVK